MPLHRVAILSARRSGAEAVLRLLEPFAAGRSAGSRPFHWDRPWGAVSREFHQGSPERARTLLDDCLSGGALFRHGYDAESWDFNQMLLEALAKAGYRLLVIERALSVEHLFSVIVAELHDCRDADAVARLRARLQGGDDVEPLAADDVRQRVFGQWQTHHWFQRALAACPAQRLACRHESLFLRGVAGLAAVDELFAFAGLAPRNALVDDASLLRFLWAGQHYTAGLVAYSPVLRAMRLQIEAEFARLQSQPTQAAGRADVDA